MRIQQLTHEVEVELVETHPTDPSKPDTDGDGLTDTEEIIGFKYENLRGGDAIIDTDPTKGYATNPLHRDTDSDGLDDFRETQLGTNPLVVDGDSVFDDDGDGLVNIVEDNATRPDSRWSVTRVEYDPVLPTICSTEFDRIDSAACESIGKEDNSQELPDFACTIANRTITVGAYSCPNE